jgi:hypothetical protein
LLVIILFGSQFTIKTISTPAMGTNTASTEGADEDNGVLHMDGGSGTLRMGVLDVGDLDALAGGGDDMTAANVLCVGNGAG